MEKKRKNSILSKKCGFSIIEALVFLFVFSISAMAFFSAMQLTLNHSINSKQRLAAMAIANERMEIIRSLQYDNVGTRHLNTNGTYSYGVPGGDVLEDESITVNNSIFQIHTFVQYIDDELDGEVSGTSPVDTTPTDYKRVKVEVSWGDAGIGNVVALVASISPPGVEVPAGGGVLSINIIDETGAGVSGATVHIQNNSVSPHVDLTTNTDSTGNIMLPGTTPSLQTYGISVAKNDYYSVSTLPPYPTTTYKPSDIHASVVVGTLSQKTISFSRNSDIKLITKNGFGETLEDIGFHITGGRQLGVTSATPAVPVYSVSNSSFSTNSSGEKELLNQSPGIYTVSFDDTDKYQLLRFDIEETVPSQIIALPGTAKTVNATLLDKDAQSLLVQVTDSASNVVLDGVSVHVENASASYDATIETDRYGQAFFPTGSPELADGTYTISITYAGYQNYTGSASISDGKLNTKSILLVKS